MSVDNATDSVNAAYAAHAAGSLVGHLSNSSSRRRSLSKHLSKDKCGRDIDSLRCVLLTALDISKAVRFMHGSNFIHGDLKPHNILIADASEVLPATHLHCSTAWLTWRFARVFVTCMHYLHLHFTFTHLYM